MQLYFISTVIRRRLFYRAPINGTTTPNQGVLPPVHIVVALWIPVVVAAFASETIPGLTLGATVIPVYPAPGLAVKLQQGTDVTANIRSLAFTVGPLVVIVAVVPPVEFPACPKLSTRWNAPKTPTE